MKEEVRCACEFISKMLEMRHLPHQFVNQFRVRLEQVLSERFKDHWDTGNPNKGSAYRCIRINTKMDPIISEAAKATGLKNISKYLPAEFTMWIDPRDVSYRFGEDGSICSCVMDSRSEWSSSKRSSSPSSTISTPTDVSSPPSRSKSASPSTSYYHEVYRNLSSRLIQVQVWSKKRRKKTEKLNCFNKLITTDLQLALWISLSLFLFM